jgi:hypothetical protein
MSNCGGLHCPGCGKHGGAGLIVLLVVLAVVCSAVRAAWHSIVTGVEIFAYTVLGIAAAVAIAAAAYAGWRIRAYVLASRAQPPSPQVRAVITDAKPGRPVLVPDITHGSIIDGRDRPSIEAPRMRAGAWLRPTSSSGPPRMRR